MEDIKTPRGRKTPRDLSQSQSQSSSGSQPTRTPVTSPTPPPGVTVAKHTFQVSTPELTFYFVTKSLLEKTMWITEISKVIDDLHKHQAEYKKIVLGEAFRQSKKFWQSKDGKDEEKDEKH